MVARLKCEPLLVENLVTQHDRRSERHYLLGGASRRLGASLDHLPDWLTGEHGPGPGGPRVVRLDSRAQCNTRLKKGVQVNAHEDRLLKGTSRRDEATESIGGWYFIRWIFARGFV